MKKFYMEKWDIPEGCKMLGESALHYIGLSQDRSALTWRKSDGFCRNAAGLFVEDFNLIPKKPPIEESEEYKKFSKWFPKSSGTKVGSFKRLCKIFPQIMEKS